MRVFILIFFITSAVPVFSQKNLSGSVTGSFFKYIYKINPDEALSLFKSNLDKVDEHYLHTLVDSFPSTNHIPLLNNGNYLTIYAKENKLHYDLSSVGDLSYKLVNNDRDLIILLHDKQGQVIDDAEVYIKKRRISYDPVTQTYRLNNRKKPGSFHVIRNGVLYFFSIEQQKKYLRNYDDNTWKKIKRSFPLKYVVGLVKRKYYGNRSRHNIFFNNNTANESRYRGFMVFNKPIYKPGDTVKLKAYIMNKQGKALDEPLLVRLTNRNFITDTIISVVKPYRNGAYDYQFVLSNELHLDLDKEYMITLEEEDNKRFEVNKYAGNLDEEEYAMKRKVAMRGKFDFEEYELKSLNFSVRSDKKDHSRGNIASLYLKATDENEMAVLDGRVQILATPLSYSANFSASKVFLPDTLLYQEITLDAIGETKFSIPDSIFPAASFSYELKCTLLNTSNETRYETLTQSFKNDKYKIVIEQANDSLKILHLANGKRTAVNAMAYAFNLLDDTIEAKSVQLPAILAINPYAATYNIKTDSADEMFNVHQTNGMVAASAFRTKDSVSIQLINPYHLKVWYTLFAGKKILSRGYGNSLIFRDKSRTHKNYFVSLQYLFEDKVYHENYTVPLQDKLLSIKVNQPAAVFPGQTATIDLSVTDASGIEVPDADITAYSFTRKFENAKAPVVPYLGKRYAQQNRRQNIFTGNEIDYKNSFQLNWKRWSREMALDTIEYYKFVHPSTIYINTEPSKDGVTQVAPFVVINGDLQPIHLLYIDEKPTFFSQSHSLQRYSFKVSEGKHSFRLRTQNKTIVLDSVFIKAGVKTFICVNADTITNNIHIQEMPDTLTAYEKNLWSKYMILVENNFGESFTYIRQGDFLYLLNGNGQQASYLTRPNLVGPLFNRYSDFVVKNKFDQTFEAEGGYQYDISKGLIKQKQLKNPYSFDKFLFFKVPAYNFSDFILTENEIDSLWQDYLDHRSANEDLYHNSNLNKSNNGQLRINITKKKQQPDIFIKNILLFRYDDPDFLRVYKGAARDLGYVKPGEYRLLLLLKKSEYFIVDNINIRKNGINYYETGTIIPKAQDSTSMVISRIINGHEKFQQLVEAEDMNQLKTTFNEKYVEASSFNYVTIGQVRDDQGLSIPGAIIGIKRLKNATSSDNHGNFKIATPRNAVLIISSVGYETKELSANSDEFQVVVLKASKMSLQEVVVVGYGIQRKQSLTASILNGTEFDKVLAGKAAGIEIKGIATNSAAMPLIIMNGLPYAGSMKDIDPSLIKNIEVLNQATATSLYGEMAANGVILLTTKTGTVISESQDIPNINSLRKNFHDDAYWQPKLRTDNNGKVSFKVTFPDDITNWRTFVIAMADHKRTGFNEGSIKSFKALSGSLSLPQFLVEGDSINIIGKALNYLSDSIVVKRSFSINDSLIEENEINFRNSRIDTFSIIAPSKDSLRLKYTIKKQDNYFDGEEKTVPIFKLGSLETNGIFAALQNDTSFSLKMNPTLGTVKLYAETSLLPVILDEIESIRKYEYLCNEQLASKLKALLLKRRIYQYLKKNFKEEKNILEIISKLNQSKSHDLWGWWKSNDVSLWISLHVLEALTMAEQDGYKINLDKKIIIDFLVYNLESYKGEEKLYALHVLQSLKANINYKEYIDSLESKTSFNSLYEKLLLLSVRQKTGQVVSLDAMIAKSKTTMFGNLYWGEERYNFFDNTIQNTLLMYKLLKSSGGHDFQLLKIRNYFLEKRRSGKWQNTYESSMILETILPDLLKNDTLVKPSFLTITASTQTLVTSFPFSMQLNSNEIINVSKKGSWPVYFTAYQQSWNPAPGKVSGDFEVHVSFEKNDRPIISLKAGEPVTLKTFVTVKGDADFVMIEIPVPAGCSYNNKNQSYRNNEVHREYFKNKVSIFCSSLKKGSYIFYISLLPRYTGSVYLNPAKAEMMYFPVFYGREEMKKITIF